MRLEVNVAANARSVRNEITSGAKRRVPAGRGQWDIPPLRTACQQVSLALARGQNQSLNMALSFTKELLHSRIVFSGCLINVGLYIAVHAGLLYLTAGKLTEFAALRGATPVLVLIDPECRAEAFVWRW